MTARRHLSSLLVGAVALGIVIVGALAARSRGADNPLRTGESLCVCEAAQPVAGGEVYLYVVDEQNHVVTILKNGELAASYALPGAKAGEVGWYTVRSGRAEPVAGGNAYCFVIDPHLRKVHVFRDAEYAGTEGLPTEGDRP